jgi:poly(A) polymerase
LESFSKEYHTVYHTSVSIIPPPGPVYDKLMETRRGLGDEDYNKWPPHINLLYPFVERSNFKSVIPILNEGLKDIEPFELILTDFGVFGSTSYRGIFRGILWVDPTVRGDHPDSLALLQSKLEGVMPFCTEQRLKLWRISSSFNLIEV